MHDVLTGGEFVDAGGERPSIDDALLIRVEIAGTLATIPMNIDGPLPRASFESTCLLVECVVLGTSRNERLAAILSAARVFSYGDSQ